LNSILLPRLESKAARRRRRLHAFRPPFRRYVAGLTSCSAAVEDLADSFPALLFAMATGYGTAAQREAAFQAIEDGLSLKEAAALLGLPLWLRRIPASALGEPLPRLPCDEAFSAEVINRIPDGAAECAAWLDRVLIGQTIVGRDMALWIAREPRLLPPLTSEDSFHWIIAWAWASITPGSPGHAMLRGAWAPDIGLKRTIDEVAIWRKRIDLVGALADTERDPWFANGTAGGFEIVQLASVQDFIAESAAMENCLDQYAAHLAYGRVRIFSVRKDGRPVADVELTLRSDDSSMACVSQIRGPRNRRAAPFVWQAVTSWLAAQPLRALRAASTPSLLARAALDRFWQPYHVDVQARGLAHRLTGPQSSQDLARRRMAQPRAEAQARAAAPQVDARATTLVQRVVRLIDG
jgi:hypothetical protein